MGKNCISIWDSKTSKKEVLFFIAFFTI
jgi:hypothetical protein